VISAAIVTIVINGAIVSSAAPGRIVGGRVAAPVSPIVVRLASQVAYTPETATVAVERDGRRIVVPVIFTENGIPYVALAPLVRGLGGSAVFDAPTKTLAIALGSGGPIETSAPFNPQGPTVAPTTVFTPAPSAAPRRAPETGVPHPRRTAIPATPSQPVVPPVAEPTNPRLRES